MVAERVKASSDAEHFKKKHADEEAATKDAGDAANSTEVELVVRVYHPFHTPSLSLPTRNGLGPPEKWFR